MNSRHYKKGGPVIVLDGEYRRGHGTLGKKNFVLMVGTRRGNSGDRSFAVS